MRKRVPDKKDTARPVLTRRCKKCGKIFAACHPKDPQEYCEKCRRQKNSNDRKDL